MRCISHACIISYNDWRLIEKYGAVINICRPVLRSLKGPTELYQMSHESANENNIVVGSLFKPGFLLFLFLRSVLFIFYSLRFHTRILFLFTYLFIRKCRLFVYLAYIRTSLTIARYTNKIDKFWSVKKQRFSCVFFLFRYYTCIRCISSMTCSSCDVRPHKTLYHAFIYSNARLKKPYNHL